MTKRKQPKTSILAHNSIKESKSAMYAKIVKALEIMRVGGNFEEISTYAGLEPAQVWKRLSELVELGICFNTGITHKTSSGRSAMVRQLTNLKPKPQTGKVVQVDLFS